MIDFSLKSKVLDDYDILKEYINLKKVLYRFSTYGIDSGYSLDYYNYCNDKLISLIDEFGSNYIRECERIWHASRMRTSRLRKRISYMLSKPCLFLTFTFTDEILDSTTADTRKNYVSRFLREYNTLYIANIDYGRINEREHYHAVIMAEKVDYILWHKFGAIKGEKVRNNTSIDEFGLVSKESCERLSKYINKLTNHAIKETTKGNRIIYSRNFKSLCLT